MAQIKKFQSGGSQKEIPKTHQNINVEGLGDFDPEALRTTFAQDPDKWYTMTGADPKYRTQVITRMGEILDMSKEYGMSVDNAGTYTFNNPVKEGTGINDKYKSTGEFPKKGIFGLGGTRMDDNAVNNLAYYTIGKLIREGQNKTGSASGDSYLSEVEARLKSAEENKASEEKIKLRNAFGSIDWENFTNTGMYSGNTPNIDNFRSVYSTDSDRFGKVRSELQLELNKLNDPEWDTKNRWIGTGTREDYTKNLQGLINSLSGNNWNNDVYKAAYNLGAADWLQPFLDSSYVATSTSNPQGIIPYKLGDNVKFADGYDANRIYQAAKERWPNSEMFYDSNKKQLAFNNISYDPSIPFTPYLSNYADVHQGTWYGGYYYGPGESIPGITDAELETINTSRKDDIFKDDTLTWKELQGDTRYDFDPNSDELPEDIFGNSNIHWGMGRGVLVNMTDLFTDTGGRTIIKYTGKDTMDKNGKNATYQLVEPSGRLKNGTIKKVPGKGIVFIDAKDKSEINLGSVNPQGSHKPFDIKKQGKVFNINYYDPKAPELTRKNIENGLRQNKHDIINNIYRKMSTTPFVESDRSEKTKYGDLKYLSYNPELGGGSVTNPKNKAQKLAINTEDLTLYWVDKTSKYQVVQVPIKKEGGTIIKGQDGFKASDIERARYNQLMQEASKISQQNTPSQQHMNIGWVDSNRELNRDKFNSKQLTFKDLGDDEISLSNADKLELTSVGADLLSIVAGFVPGAHWIGTGLGVAGTGTQFVADIMKDGLDSGNAGNFLMNLGMDAVSLIPVAGSSLKLGAKSSKYLKNIPKLAKYATMMGLAGAAGTLNKMYVIMKDPNRSLSEMNMDDVKNLMTIARLGQYGIHKSSIKQSKPGANVEPRNTFDVIKSDGTRSQVELSKTQLEGLGNQKKASEKTSYLKNIVAEATKTDPSLKDASPIVDRFSLSSPWKSKPFAGRANINTTQVKAGTTELAFKRDLNSSSAYSRYLARLREYKTSDILGRKSNALEPGNNLTTSSKTNTSNSKSQEELSNRIIESRKKIVDTEKQVTDIRSKIARESNNPNKQGSGERVNNLVKEEKLLSDQLSNLNRSLKKDTDLHKNVVLNLRNNSKPAEQELSKEAKALIDQLKISRIEKRKAAGAEKTKQRIQNKEKQDKQANEFFDQIRQSVNARIYRNSGNLFGRTYNASPLRNNIGYTLPSRPVGNDNFLQRKIPFRNPNLPEGGPFANMNWYFKDGGKIIKAQSGIRTAEIKKYPQLGIQYGNNFSDYDSQRTTTSGVNPLYGSIESDLSNRLSFYQKNLPSWVTGNMISNGTANTSGNNVLEFQNRYNTYNNATRDYFLKRGWGNKDEVNEYASKQGFLPSNSPNTSRVLDNKLGNYTSTRAAWINPMVSPDQLKQLNSSNIFTAQNALSNAEQAKKILGDALYNDVVLDLTPGSGADYVIGERNIQSPVNQVQQPVQNSLQNPVVETPKNTGSGVGANQSNNQLQKQTRLWDPVPLMRGAEAMLGIIGNNKLEAPVRTSKDPLDLYSFVSGDLQQRSMLANQAAKTRRWASKPFTSDASLQSARELDAEMKANDLTAQGWLADQNAIRETGYRALERQYENARNRNQISNLNRDIFDQNNASRISLKNQVNLANFGIAQNVVRDIKNEMIMNREAVRQAEVGYQQQQNSLDYAATQQRLRNEASLRSNNAERYRADSILANQELNILKKDDTNYKQSFDALKNRIAENERRVKLEEDWISGIGDDSYYQQLLNANRTLNTRNMESSRNVASDNRWTRMFGPYGYSSIFKSGGQLSYRQKAELQNAKEANISQRSLSRNLTKRALSEAAETQKMIREVSRTYRDVLLKFANKPTPRLK